MKIFLIAKAEEAPPAIDQLSAAFDVDTRSLRHETAGADLTRTALDVELRSPQITREVAAHVLAHFGAGGYLAGSYVRDLILLIARADPHRRRRLALAEPAYVLAVSMAQGHTMQGYTLAEGGVDLLRAIAAGETAVTP